MIVDTLKVTVGFVVDLFAKVLVCFRPHLRKIGLKKKGGSGGGDIVVTVTVSVQHLYSV